MKSTENIATEDINTCVYKVRKHIGKKAYDSGVDSLKFANELISNTKYGFTAGNLTILCRYGLGNLACKAMDIIIERRVGLNRRLRQDEVEYIVNSVIKSTNTEDAERVKILEEELKRLNSKPNENTV